MTTLTLEVPEPLTDLERQKLQAYARSLIASRSAGDEGSRKHINVDAIRGLFAGLEPDKSDKQLIREAWDDIVAKYDDPADPAK